MYNIIIPFVHLEKYSISYFFFKPFAQFYFLRFTLCIFRFHSGEVVCTGKLPAPENIRTYIFQGITKVKNIWRTS